MALPPLRPPGALDEPEFLKHCVQCGRCAQACPFGTVVLSMGLDPFASGTPRIEPWSVPCWLCMRCPPACPTGALRTVPMDRAGMGLAFIDKDRCFTYAGSIFCKTCHDKCPLRNTALVMEAGLFPVVTEACVGCGVCEHVCPAKAVVTVPRSRVGRKASGGWGGLCPPQTPPTRAEGFALSLDPHPPGGMIPPGPPIMGTDANAGADAGVGRPSGLLAFAKGLLGFLTVRSVGEKDDAGQPGGGS